MSLFGKREVQSVPHPELVPLTEEECVADVDLSRIHTSKRDYSMTEVKEALEAVKVSGSIPGDILEYCHSNGIDWKMQVSIGSKQR
jgi:hypothetical protein